MRIYIHAQHLNRLASDMHVLVFGCEMAHAETTCFLDGLYLYAALQYLSIKHNYVLVHSFIYMRLTLVLVSLLLFQTFQMAAPSLAISIWMTKIFILFENKINFSFSSYDTFRIIMSKRKLEKKIFPLKKRIYHYSAIDLWNNMKNQLSV